jgi:hypothetical protein
MSKAPTLCSTKVLYQEDSKFAGLVLQGVEKALFFTSYTMILQFIWSIYLVNLFGTFLTHCFSTLGRDPPVGSKKNKSKFNLSDLH